MREQHLLDLGGIHVEARHDDQVLQAIDDVEVSVIVANSEVSGLEPPVRRQYRSRCHRVVQVARKDVLAANPDLSLIAVLDFVSRLIHESQFDTVNGATDGTDAHLETHRVRHHGRGLGEPVTLADFDTKLVAHHRDRVLGHLRCARECDAHAGEIGSL